MPLVRVLACPLAVAVAVAVAGCAPALNWRELRPDAGFVALLPCKPATAARDLLLAGRSVRLTLHACSAGGQTWAVASADVAEPASVAPALDELRRSAVANLQAAAPVSRPLSVRGATPNAASTRLALDGRLPDGQPVREEMAVFSKGTRVYQATVLGPAPPADGVETFFGSLRFA